MINFNLNTKKLINMTTSPPTFPPHLCNSETWIEVIDDSSPRAVRWVGETSGNDVFNDPRWSKWHWTEGNGLFTACNRAVVLFMADGSPQEGGLVDINCKACLAKMSRHGAGVAPLRH